MSKKAYKTPSTKTIMLRQQVTLLAGSNGVEAERTGYASTDSDIWE